MKQRIREWLYWNIGWVLGWVGVAVYFGAIAYLLVEIIWG